MNGREERPGLYVHVPFCARICPYCDFAVEPLGRSGAGRLERYRQALLREIGLRAGPFGADTVYFGGGTPSLAPAPLLAGIVRAAVRSGLAAPSPAVFLEANPEDVAGDPVLARDWAAAGVFGVSLGAQAFAPARLRRLGRAHAPADIGTAVSRLREAGVPWISLDLIYGAAGQSPAALRAELAEAASLPGVTHLSAYELTVEPGTPFGRRAAAGERLTADGGSDLFRTVHESLRELGFVAYEASNFARAPEHRSRHNRKYWNGTAYLGLGPSAHSFAPERAERSWNHRASADWEAALARGELPVAGRETLTPTQRALEEVFLGLRTAVGLDLAAFAARYGEAAVAANRARFRAWVDRGLARRDGAFRLSPTLRGLALADALAREVDLGAVGEHRRA